MPYHQKKMDKIYVWREIRQIRKKIKLFLLLLLAPFSLHASTLSYSITLNTSQQIQVFLKPLPGKTIPPVLDIKPVWSVLSGSSTLDVSTDSLSAWIIASSIPGDSIVLVNSNNSDILSMRISVHVVKKFNSVLLNSNDAEVNPEMKLYISSTASNGNYIASVSSSFGSSTYYVYVDTYSSDTYNVFARMLAKTISSDSFFISMDSGSFDVVTPLVKSPDWQWVKSPQSYFLLTGVHQLTFKTREPDSGLDQVLITNDIFITTATLLSYPTYYQGKNSMDDAVVRAIIHNEIKPIYDLPVNLISENERCTEIWDIVVKKIDPIYDDHCGWAKN